MGGDPIKILLVEDNAGDARLLREFLNEPQGMAFGLRHVERLSEARAALKEDSFEAILLDLSLPDAQGLDTISQISPYIKGKPIVVLTGLDDEEITVKALQQGAQDYLIKGQVDGQLLARSLRHAIQRQKTEEALKARNRELSILREISETLLGSSDLSSVLDSILEKAMLGGSFDLGNIRLLDRRSEVLEVAAGRGYRDHQNMLGHRRISRAKDSGSSVFKERLLTEPCIEENVQGLTGLRTLRREGVQSLIIVPLRAEGEVLGIIQLASREPRKFKPEEINLLTTIGNQIGVAVHRARLYEETKRQAVELERANQMQADFAAMMAHDLRSPLMNITGTAEVMIDGLFGSINEDQRKWLSKILASGRSLVDLVSDFLDISKLEAGYVDISKEAVDLRQLIQENLENHRIVAQDKQISLREAVDPALPLVEADSRRLEQVLDNLISNAVKFTGEGGEIEVAAVRQSAGEARVWVRDNGEGIAAEEIGQLFEKYRQCSNIKNCGGRGTGLGLAICKMIVEAHGGKIWAESQLGNGSTFYFSLPLSPDGNVQPRPA